MTVVFRVDASSDIGSGHVSRCLNLADALRARGVASQFVTRMLPGHLGAWIEARGYGHSLLRAPREGEAVNAAAAHSAWLGVESGIDAAETAAALGALSARPSWLVCDHYAIDASWQRTLRPHVDRIMVIDDLADRPHDCDLLLDQNALPSLQRDYALLVPDMCRRLFGPDYALMSSEYGENRPLVPVRRGAVRRVLVFFGGADKHDLTGRTLEAIAGLPANDIVFDVVVGTAYQRRASLAERIGTLPGITLHAPQASLAPLMVSADLAIGAGGVTMWERCALGLPSLVITVAENQHEGTAAAAAAGLVTLIGDHRHVDAAAIADALHAAIAAGADERMSRHGAAVVDGLGTRRTAAAMFGPGDAPLRLRRADPCDEERLRTWANDPETRRQAFQPAAISVDGHARWFVARLRDIVGCRLLIAETADGIPAGQLRFDRDGDAWLISYSIDAALRGYGLGGKLIAAGMAQLQADDPVARFRALVKSDNIASNRVFVTAGFERYPSSVADDSITYVWEPFAAQGR